MNKKTYLSTLNKYLKHLPDEDRADIIAEYETHFISGKEDGQSEEMIADELGKPKEIAKEINATLAIDRAENNNKMSNVWHAIISVMGLGILNFFVILIPIVAIVSILLSFMAITLTLLLTPTALLIKGVYNGFNTILHADIFIVVASFGLGLMFFTVTYLLTKWSFKVFVKYLRWNISIIKGSAKA
ncbi:HAAS signaling domain-containing protein [Mammaliicoccus stepanovicii]|uniref:Predicted membrane protein n=1 Tax=Mammaliicoccus stepanovicii TaxID=643214 RepID=A0A240AEI6_9STAP|nr:DUF1700 domain-containing protein [Mammaliicoccus stepanovicii]PNZ77841.1 DUF1700 domain-containing protein [Mammaliicoccus stepanovicii]GGI43140.1 hypothetical protein GCM10010896_21950 [Mammaliicoccus stepanovicii]SNV81316.1 Predicted membrane protein [Mammaliicoccus stepanovicii]